MPVYDAYRVVLQVPVHPGCGGDIVRRGDQAGDGVAAHMCTLDGRRKARRGGFGKTIEQRPLAHNSERVNPVRLKQGDIIVEERTRGVEVATVQGAYECAEHGLGILSFCRGAVREWVNPIPKSEAHNNRGEHI